MSDESLFVFLLLLGLAVMIVGLVRYQRGKERRIAARAEIEIPIDSMWRSALALVPSLVAGPTIVVTLAATLDEARKHAVAMTLTALGVGMIGLWTGMRLSRHFRRVGVLRYTSASLDFELGDVHRHLDLSQPYALAEGLAFGPAHMPLQVVSIAQNGDHWGFSYGLPLGRKPYGDRSLDSYLAPLLPGETRIIHDRLRERIERRLQA
jgi:hypothetical protein